MIQRFAHLSPSHSNQLSLTDVTIPNEILDASFKILNQRLVPRIKSEFVNKHIGDRGFNHLNFTSKAKKRNFPLGQLRYNFVKDRFKINSFRLTLKDRNTPTRKKEGA